MHQQRGLDAQHTDHSCCCGRARSAYVKLRFRRVWRCRHSKMIPKSCSIIRSCAPGLFVQFLRFVSLKTTVNIVFGAISSLGDKCRLISYRAGTISKATIGGVQIWPPGTASMYRRGGLCPIWHPAWSHSGSAPWKAPIHALLGSVIAPLRAFSEADSFRAQGGKAHQPASDTVSPHSTTSHSHEWPYRLVHAHGVHSSGSRS